MKKGFTLIELLVVIAIIGILASVVVSSLNVARNKGIDAAIKASLASTRSQSEFFYDSGSTYQNVCTSGAENISNLIIGSGQNLTSSFTTPGDDNEDFVYDSSGTTAGSVVCHDNALFWAAIVSLKNPLTPDAGWCVDSSGAAKEATSLAAGDYDCQ